MGGENLVQILGHEARVFEEEQECEVVKEADEQPDAAAGKQRPNGHQQHEQGDLEESRPQRCRQDQRRSDERRQERHGNDEGATEKRIVEPSTAFSAGMVHQRHEQVIQDRGIRDEDQVPRIPPPVKDV